MFLFLRGDEPDFTVWEESLLEKLYQSYRIDPADRPTPCSLRLHVAFSPHSKKPGGLCHGGRLFRVQDNGNTVVFERLDFSGTMTMGAGGDYEGRFVVTEQSRHTLESLIRICLSHVLAGKGKLLLHASAVQRAGRLHLFSGRSGAGKTTIASELNGGGAAVAFDRIALGVGEDGRVVGEGTPFSDEEGVVRKQPPHAVSGIFFIVQDIRDSIRLLDGHDAAKRLLRDGMPPSRNRLRDERLLAMVERISDARMCYELGFRRSEGYWKLIDELTQ